MLSYYIDLAFRSLRRNKVLTGLMVLAIAMGIGASMTMLTVLHVLSGDPLPGRSAQLYYPQIDPRGSDGQVPGQNPPAQMTWIDAMNLLKAHKAERQAAMTGGSVPVQPAQSGMDPFFAPARYTTADFFPMFQVPFLFGHAWNGADDDARARVAVISRSLNDKLFGGKDSVGRTLRVNDADLRIVGVIDAWRPHPHFYDINTGGYADSEDVFVPLTTSRDIKLERNGNMNCWGQSNPDDLEHAPCVWLQYWVQLATPADAKAYRQYLVNYSAQQKSLGRFERAPNVRLMNLMQWLDFNHVVPSDVRLQTWLAFGFLLVCLVNTVGLLLAKFMRRSAEIGVRRALGASRREVFVQMLCEAGIVGLIGGVVGLLLAWLGLWLVRKQPSDYAALAHLDVQMLLITFVIAVGATLVAGLLPSWRACQITPALQLKSQ